MQSLVFTMLFHTFTIVFDKNPQNTKLIMRPILLAFLFLILLTNVQSQNIFWATDVKEYSSQYSLDRHSANEVLGVPNVAPIGMSSTYAWRVQPNSIDNEGVETAYIDVGFNSSPVVQQVVVFESYNPGAVAEIFVQTTNGWKSVYTNKNVIERTAYHEFEGNENSNLKKNAGTVKSRFRLFKPDTLFAPKNKHNIVHAFFDAEKIFAVRVVLNLFAIDGWNEIDAIAIANSHIPVSYPKVNEIREPIFAENNKHHLSRAVNTVYSELKPVISTDENELYFTRTNHWANSHKNTQDIWYSENENIRKPSCEYNCEPKYQYQWQPAKHYGNPFCNLIPNAVLGYSSNGKYMFLNNLYKPVSNNCDCDSVLKQSTSGISYSKMDTTNWQEAGSKIKKKLKRKVPADIEKLFISPNGKIVAAIVQDTLYTKTNKPVVFMAFNQGDSVFSDAVSLGAVHTEMQFEPPEYIPQTHRKILLQINGNKVDACKGVGWTMTQPLNIDGFLNTSNYIDIDIAHNDTVMFLSIDSKGSIGKRDLYVSFRKGENSWSEPQNLGTTINTLSDDDSPFLDDDDLMFYFASAGHNGYGNRDIYVCRRLDDTYLNWTKPLNLGRRVNTVNSDAFFAIAPNSRMAYFSSTDNTIGCNGKSDIYSIRMLKPINLTISGKVYDIENYPRVLDANIKMNNIYENGTMGFKSVFTRSQPNTGSYMIKMNEIVQYEQIDNFAINAIRDGYIQVNENGDSIAYDIVNIERQGRNITIYKNLYLKGAAKIKDNEYIAEETDIEDPFEEMKADTLSKKDLIEKKKKKDPDVIIPKKTEIDLVVPSNKQRGCGTLFYADNLYYVPPIYDKNDFVQIKYLEMAYEKYFDYNEKSLKEDETAFNKFLTVNLSNKTKLLGTNDTLKVHIISSASKVPTLSYSNNQALSEARANEAEAKILKYLKSIGFDTKKCMISKDSKVQGKNYEKDRHNAIYKDYQYVKIWVMVCEGRK